MVRSLWGKPTHEYLNAITIASTQAIAGMGATSIFIMEGVNVVNKSPVAKPLKIDMPGGQQKMSTHVCNITIPRLPTVLTWHIVPQLTVASLIDNRPSFNAGFTVLFDRDKCDVIFNGSVMLSGYKDATIDLWTLPIKGCSEMRIALSHKAPVLDSAPNSICPDLHPGVDLASFTHSVCTRANGVKFAHQSLCNPKIFRLLKAVHKGFLKGCPNLTKKLILKYLNLSLAITKGHMKRPCHRIKSTQPKTVVPRINCNAPPMAQAPPANMEAAQSAAFFPQHMIPILITKNCKDSIANVFCFGAFTDHHSGVVYNKLQPHKKFPFHVIQQKCVLPCHVPLQDR